MKKRKIIAVSGARSEYDLLYNVYKRLNEDERFDFSIIITGPNLSDTFGYTAKFIEQDEFEIAGYIFNSVDSNQKIGRIVSLGLQIPSLANILFSEKPDMVLVAGDREEAISVTMTCAYLDIPVAHFFGGDIVKNGHIDNSVRYAASKFAHIHFPSLPQHKETLLRLGEDEWRIFVVGNPAIDRLISVPTVSKKELFDHLAVAEKRIDSYCVLIQHPGVTTDNLQSVHIRMTLDALLSTDRHVFINYPNSDAGFSEILKAYQEYSSNYPEKFTLFKNLDRINYTNLLKHSDFLIGNSSSGIVEVASLGLPAINIGDRQQSRLHGQNVVFADYSTIDIEAAIDKVLNDKEFKAEVAMKNNPYGDGKSAKKVIDVLSEIIIDDRLIHKSITY